MLFFNLIKEQFTEIFFRSLYDLRSFLLISDKLSVRFDIDACINLQLSTSFNMYVISLPFSFIILSGAEKVIYFSMFSPKQSRLPLNSSDNSLIMK